jgi:DNA-directed RNA polymerase specialized sigma24 family protein
MRTTIVPLRSAIGNCEAVGCLTSATRFAIELLTECRTKNTPFFSNATMTAIRSRRFATTQWSIVKAAAGKSSAAAKTALENLCTTYWTPVYAFVRQRGYSQPDAEDLTQAFFMHLLDSDFLQTADRDRGRFRSFLLKSVSNFLSVDRRKRDTEKRGGQIRILERSCHPPSIHSSKSKNNIQSNRRRWVARFAINPFQTQIVLLAANAATACSPRLQPGD